MSPNMNSDNTITPSIESTVECIDYSAEVKKLINVDEKQWNTHMLRVCARKLLELPKKEFTKKRYLAVISRNVTLEKKVLEDMLSDKAKTLNPDEFSIFYKRLLEFESHRLLHPRKKYGIY